MSKIFAIPFLLLFFVQLSYGQQPSVREWRERADTAYAEGNYPAAFKFYEAALKYRISAQDSLELLYKYAESARQFNAFVPAETAYQVVTDKDQGKQFPLSRYWLAIVEQRQEKYEEAALHFEQFLQQNPAPSEPYQAWAQRGLDNVEQAQRAAGVPQPILPTRLGRDVNDSNAEYVADFMGDTLIYSTLNDIYNKDTHKPPRKYTKIYTSVSGQESQPWDALNEPGKHVSNLIFNRDQTRMYYTVCEYKENSVIEVRCDIYMRERQQNDTWSDKKPLTVINLANYTNTQPTLAFDAQHKREWLFFVSDRPTNAADTTKDLNIWYGTVAANGDVTSIIAADALNTDGNEASPSFYAPTQTLYFSSTGRKPSYGGYDIYEADMMSNGGWTEIKPLNRPINSGYDELHFVLRDSKIGTDAYFSTNMPIDTVEETYVDPRMKACCWDIFKVNFEIKLQVKTFLASNGTNVPLNGSTISLYVETPSGSVLDTTAVSTNGNMFLFHLLPNKKYTIVGKHPTFNYEQTETIDPIRTEYIGGKLLERNFVFTPLKMLVHTYKRKTGAPLDSAQVVVNSTDGRTVTGKMVDNHTFSYEVQAGKQYQINGKRIGFYDENASADLTDKRYRDSAQVVRNLYFRQELEVLVVDAETSEPLGGATVNRKLLADSGIKNLEERTNPADSNRFLYGYEVFDMTEKYRLEVSKARYSSKTQEVVFTPQQIRNSNGKFVVVVALEKRDFLPITLYFDNDIPGPSDRRVTQTAISYRETFEKYYRRKQEFLNYINTAPGYTSEERFNTSERYESIFERELRQEYQNLQALSGEMLDLLKEGSTVEITIEGFCSPLGSREYNESLSRRRIDCIVNHFLRYDGGKLMPYFRSRKLIFNRVSNGEAKANPRAQAVLGSNDRKNRQKGIFDIYATLERRVVITRLTINGETLTSLNYNLNKKTTK